MKNKIYQIVIIGLLFYPLIFIIIPSFFGYYLYGPLNSNEVVIGSLIGSIGISLLIKSKPYPKKLKYIFMGLVLFSIIPYFLLSYARRIGNDMNLVVCENEFYVERGSGGGFYSFTTGGGVYENTALPLYKRKIDLSRANLLRSNC